MVFDDTVKIKATENEALIKIFANPHVAGELREELTFDVPHAKYDKKFKQGLWDGKIRLFSPSTRLVYRGLLSKIVKYCDRRDYPVEVDDELMTGGLDEKDAGNYVDFFEGQTKNTDIPLLDYQKYTIKKALMKKRGVFLCPTGSGKSLILYGIFRKMHEMNKPVVIIVTSKALVEQLYKDFINYSEEMNDGINVEEIVQRLYGKEKYKREKFSKTHLITTWQSLIKQEPGNIARYECVLGDEAHKFKAKSFSEIMTNLSAADFRVGVTGTTDGKMIHDYVLQGLFGEIENIISTTELIERGNLSKLNINCALISYDADFCRSIKDLKPDRLTELKIIARNKKRNKFIIDYSTLKRDSNILILYELVEDHGKTLYDMAVASDKRKGVDRNVFIVHGGTTVDYREGIREAVSKGDKKSLIIASYGTFSTGVNIPAIDEVILASPTKSRVRVLQSIGRGLRLADGKKGCTVLDIGDDMRYGNYRNMTYVHATDRYKMYLAENFNIKIKKIRLNI